jgi:ATP-dependent DNA helicase RecG
MGNNFGIKEFEQVLGLKENQDLDFKVELPKTEKIAQLVTALYNSRGGKIILGVKDGTGKLIGLKDPQKVEHKFVQIIRHWCKLDKEPKVNFVRYKNKDFIVIDCPKGEDTPYFVKGEHVPRIRIGSSNVPAHKEEIARLYREGSSKSQDILTVENSTYDDLDLDKVKKYLRNNKLTRQLDGKYLKELMVKEYFVVKVGNKLIPTVAGILLFGKNSHLNITQCEIRADRYVGDKAIEWIDRKDIRGNLFEMIEQTENFVLKNMRTPAKVVGFKTEFRTEYPIEALREAIINALVHRDWHSSDAVLLRMFNSHIDIINPGGLLRPLKIDEILQDNYIPKSRNKILVEVLSNLGMMDKRGTGFLRIRKEMEKWDLPSPEFIEKQDSFVIRFVNPAIVNIPEIGEVGLNERQKKAVEYVKEKGRITPKEYREINDVAKEAAWKDITQLLDRALLIKKSSGAHTYYVLKPNDRPNDRPNDKQK